jgi:ribonuclease Z
MRRLLALAAVVALLAGCDRLVDRQITRNLTRVDRSILTSPDLHVVLCGTGSPLADADRAGACTAIVAGGQIYLVDVGPGSWERVDLANLPTDAVRTVLLTHFHSDHIGDLGEATTQSWIAGRAQPLDVYGPPGVARVVDGFQQAYAQDAAYRVSHHGADFLPPAGATAIAHEVALPQSATDEVVVIDRDGLRVTMFPVDHRPVAPAVGYRFDYHGRSVVVSGDTAPSPVLEQHAKDADILVHEALQPAMVLRAATIADGLGMTRLAKLARDIPAYHTTPAQAVTIARNAGVQHLVLTHLVPGPPNRLAKRIFMEGVPQDYAGEITLGEDGMHFQLAARAQ